MVKSPACLSRRNFIKLGGAALLSTAFSGFNIAKRRLHPPPIVYHGNRDQHYIALTFDDCWHPEVLEQLNEMVAPYPDFHFTFFAVGDALQINEVKDPGVWRRWSAADMRSDITPCIIMIQQPCPRKA